MTSDIERWEVCQRCGTNAERLYEISSKNEDEYGDEKEDIMKVCWDCDFDIINGGDVNEDAWNIFADRQQQAYEYDPINNSPITLQKESN